MKIQIDNIVKVLTKEVKRLKEPIVTQVANESKDPFLVLISCVLSLRTKDETTHQASDRLFRLAKTPQKMIALGKKRVEKLIYPVGFYKTKSENIIQICGDIIKKFNNRVPDEIDELLKLKGVGRKTANLVVTLGYNKPGICVDTHVHRISNRLGYVKTKSPEETEFALRKKLPKKYWITYNDLLVAYGQNICRPISPFCSKCAIFPFCCRMGVEKSR